jgi:hypothetical protein
MQAGHPHSGICVEPQYLKRPKREAIWCKTAKRGHRLAATIQAVTMSPQMPTGASGMTGRREPMLEITAFSKEDGPLTKRITIAPDGTLRSDGSACVMSSGTAWRATFDSLTAFAALSATSAHTKRSHSGRWTQPSRIG